MNMRLPVGTLVILAIMLPLISCIGPSDKIPTDSYEKNPQISLDPVNTSTQPPVSSQTPPSTINLNIDSNESNEKRESLPTTTPSPPPDTNILESKKTKPDIWIEVHDVSPGWDLWRLGEVVNITDKYFNSISKIVIFVIPNHANTTLISNYPEFIFELKSLSDRGYILGIHGYNHFYKEMNVSIERAAGLVDLGLFEFNQSNLSRPEYFVPPGWSVSSEVSEYLDSTFDYVYYSDTLKTPEGIKKYMSHEYTWYEKNSSAAFERAKKDYELTNDVFRLTVHLGAVNSDEGLDFLDKFLNWIGNNSSKNKQK